MTNENFYIQDPNYETEGGVRIFMKTSDGPYKSDDTVKVVSLCPRSDLDVPTADQWQLKNWLWRKEGEYGADAWTATHGAALRLGEDLNNAEAAAMNNLLDTLGSNTESECCPRIGSDFFILFKISFKGTRSN